MIARFAWDSHFPALIWVAPLLQAPHAEVAAVLAARGPLESALASRLAALQSAQFPS